MGRILLPVVADPTTLLVQQEQHRIAQTAMEAPWPLAAVPVVPGAQDAIDTGMVPLVQGEQSRWPMVGTYPVAVPERLMDWPRANAGVACAGGAWLPREARISPLTFIDTASVRWAISGQTLDSGGSALGSCRVVCLETGRITTDLQDATVGEAVSDGSGNYSIVVPLNTAYWLMAYKPGSPDVAGVTRNDVTPSATG